MRLLIFLAFSTFVPSIEVIPDEADFRRLMEQNNRLSEADDPESFEILLSRLFHDHFDVAYSAALALESRAQVEFASQLLEVEKRVPSERLWFYYRALGSYPSIDVADRLILALKREVNRQKYEKYSDDRNTWYIYQSIGRVVFGIKNE